MNDDPPSEGQHPAAIEIHDATQTLPRAALDWLTTKMREAMAVLKASGEVRARIVGDAEMATLHVRHTGIEGTTDVLTFDLREPPDGDSADIVRDTYALDTDIVICADEAARHAGPGGYPVEHELLLYLVHGVLHCLGHDDHATDQALAMHAEEDRILRAIGVGAVYARDGGSASTPTRSGGAEGARGGGTSG